MPLQPPQFEPFPGNSNEKRFSSKTDLAGPPKPPSLRDSWKTDQPKNVDQAYQAWAAARTPAATSELLRLAQPAISASVQRHLRTTDPVALGRAKAIVVKSLPKYDPQQASLQTFIDRQLQPMIRWQAKRQGVLKLPDRLRGEAAGLANAEKLLHDELGRYPSTRELADHTGLSAKRIAAIRKQSMMVVNDSATMPDSGEGIPDQAGDMAVHNDAAASQAWINFIRDDLPETDQYILEHTLGLDGAEKLSNKQIALNLRISPGAVSQRKLRIQELLDKETQLSPFG